jgi:hypothetical protein
MLQAAAAGLEGQINNDSGYGSIRVLAVPPFQQCLMACKAQCPNYTRGDENNGK